MPSENTTAPAKPKCGAKLRKGIGACRFSAGWGTSHVGFGRCKHHGGNTRSQVLHSAKLEAEALSLRVMGTPTHIEPEDALRFCIDITRGEIDYCDLRIGKLEEADAAAPISSDRLHEELDRHGEKHELSDRTSESTAQLHVWIVTRQGAVDRLARYSKMALDAGVEERAVRLNERQTELIAGAMLAVVSQLGSLSDEDRARLPVLLAEHVGRFDEPAIEGSVALR
jgi:hypothetical protein